MGAVFTIALFFPIIFPLFLMNSVLEKFGINSLEIFGQFAQSVGAWLEANPEAAIKIGNIFKEAFNFVVELAEKFN